MYFICKNGGYSHAKGYFELLLLFLLFPPGRFSIGRNIVCGVMRLNDKGCCVYNTGDITTRMIRFSMPEQRATGRFFHQAATTRTEAGYSFFVILCHAAFPFIIMVRCLPLPYNERRSDRKATGHSTRRKSRKRQYRYHQMFCFVYSNDHT
jgi:hypothetical protein